MKYQDIVRELTELLRQNTLPEDGGRFLSERQIASRYQVSRSTAHRAITELCRQGYLVQMHGSGTFIKSAGKTQPLHTLTSCAQSCDALGLHPSRIVLRQDLVPAGKTVAERLALTAGAPVLLLDMLYQADLMILNKTVSWLPAARFPGVERIDFTKRPLLELLRTHYRAQPRRTESDLQAVLPSGEIAAQLGISADSPPLLFESVTSGVLHGRSVPFEYFRCCYRTDVYRFRVSQELMD